MDVTVFKLEIDEPTFNAPFSERTRSDDASSTDESSGSSVKRIVGLGTVLVAALLGGVFALKRRLGGDETESESDPSPPPATEEEEENGNRGAIGALIGLVFVILVTILMKKKRASKEDEPVSPE